jgi:formylglycine-generating enzyme required for sulfatase activity
LPDQVAVIKECADCPEMQLIKGGTFMMGSDGSDAWEKPSHEVQIADFYVSKWPITRKEWNFYVMTHKDSEYQDVSDPAYEMLPATGISWLQAKGYAAWLANEYKRTYRLMSEAEWEYAARAGSSTRYFFGNDENQLGEYAWYSANSNETIHTVAQKKPNPLGLYDMYGNVGQWVKDCWHDDYLGAPNSGVAWISEDCKDRVVRGGSFKMKASDMVSTSRWKVAVEFLSPEIGFRVVWSH